jgi:rRNA maturation protein Rpf1
MLGNPSYVTEKIIEGETEGMYKEVLADCLKEVLQLYSTGTVEQKKNRYGPRFELRVWRMEGKRQPLRH